VSTNIAIWWDVPNGSKMNLWVDDAGSDVVARATVTRTDDILRPPLGHADLVPGPAAEAVDHDASLEVHPEVVFQGAALQTATIHAQVLGPTGQVIADSNGEQEYAYAVQGKAGDNPARATLSVINRDA